MSGINRPPDARTMTVIAVEFRRGVGIVGDPVRMVTAYYALNGELLAEHDVLSEPLQAQVHTAEHPASWVISDDTGKPYCAICTTLLEGGEDLRG